MNKIKDFLNSHWFKILNILLILFLVHEVFKNKYELNIQKDLVTSLNDTTKFWKDKDSLNHAKISVIQTEKVNDFLELQNLKGQNKVLQNLVKTYKNKLIKSGNSATNISTETKYDTSYTIIKNTINNLDSNYCNDTINDTISNTWIYAIYESYFMSSSQRLTNFSLSINQDYSVVIGEDKQGLFKPTKTFVEVFSNNPYTNIKGVKTYQVSRPPEKRFTIGLQGGYGYGYGLQLSTFTPLFYIGIGVQYTLFKLF